MSSRLFVYLFVLCSLTYSSLAGWTDQWVVQNDMCVSSKWGWKSCGEEADAVKIQSIKISPDPPEKGKNLTVTVLGTANQVIEDGAYVDVIVKAGRIPFIKQRVNVCEEADKANATIQCPIAEGDHLVEQTVALPELIPQTLLNVDLLGFTADEKNMVCLNLCIDFRT